MRKFTDEQFIEAVRTSETVIDVIRKLGLSECSGNYRSFHKYRKRLNVDTSHFLGQAQLRGKKITGRKRRTLDSILVENSNYSGDKLRRRLISDGILENKCKKCGQGPEWQGEILVLQLDHINGVNNDHRIDNLRILCPNCHTQTDTYCGKNKYSTR